MPITVPIRIASPASSSVIGSRVTIVCATGSSRWSVPRSPCSASPSQRTYWSGTGSSRWYLCRISFITAGSRSSAPSAIAGSPGSARTPPKTSTLARNSTIRAAPTFRRRKPPTIVQLLPVVPEVRADEAVAEDLHAPHLVRRSIAVDRVIQVDDRQVAQRALEERVVVGDPRLQRRRLTRVRQRQVDERVDVA